MPRLTLLLAVMVAACADVPEAPGTAASAAPGVLDLPPADAEVLASFFDEAQTEAALAYDRAFRTVETGADLHASLDQALALEATLLEPIFGADDVWPQLRRFQSTDLGLPGLKPTCAAECTLPALDLDLADWQAAAAHLGDPGAVAYFDALAEAYDYAFVAGGYVGGWPSYKTELGDGRGYSELGTGAHADLLARLGEAAGGAFADDLAGLFVEVRQDMLLADCIGPPLIDARAELIRVRDEGLTSDAAETLDARIAAFAVPADAGIEAGCFENDCSCQRG